MLALIALVLYVAAVALRAAEGQSRSLTANPRTLSFWIGCLSHTLLLVLALLVVIG